MSTAALMLGFGLMIGRPVAGYDFEVVFRRAYHEQRQCLDKRDELLAAPRFQGTVVLTNCLPMWLPPEDFEDGELGA